MGELPDPQVALTLLRHYASFGKLVYTLRVVPHHKQSDALQNYDSAVRDCLESFLSCTFSDSEWSLSSLSTKMGGLGLRSAAHLSSAPFLSSQAACHEMCAKIDANYTWDRCNGNTDGYAALNAYNARVSPEKRMQTIENSCP